MGDLEAKLIANNDRGHQRWECRRDDGQIIGFAMWREDVSEYAFHAAPGGLRCDELARIAGFVRELNMNEVADGD